MLPRPLHCAPPIHGAAQGRGIFLGRVTPTPTEVALLQKKPQGRLCTPCGGWAGLAVASLTSQA